MSTPVVCTRFSRHVRRSVAALGVVLGVPIAALASAPREVVLLDEVRAPLERRQPEVAIASDAGAGTRHVRLAGHGMAVPPTLDLLCPGRRGVLALRRAEHVRDRAIAVYDVPARLVETALASQACELWIVGHPIPVRRGDVRLAWEGVKPADAPVVAGRVLQVIGADTIRVALDGRTEDVRYRGVETPPAHVVAGGRAAAAFTRRLLDGKVVRLELGGEERDAEGRLLAWVWTGDRLVNAELVREGHARVTAAGAAGRHRGRLLTAQREARSRFRGVWSGRPAPAPRPEIQLAAAPARAGVEPAPNGACPVAQPIKGSAGADGGQRCVYHRPGGFFYGMTRPDRCYATPDDAVRDGCRASRL